MRRTHGALDPATAGSRRCRSARVWIACLVLAAANAHAGSQQEEALADSIRSALAGRIADAAPPEPSFSTYEEKLDYLNWLGEMGNRLQRRQPDFQARQEFLRAVWYEARRSGLDPALVLGLVEVESAFRKHAVSAVGARGYMQVMPFWTRQIGDGEPRTLFDMRSNLRYGCTILRHYLDREGGDLYMALGRYNGSRGRAEYPKAVLAAWKRWQTPGAGASLAQNAAPKPGRTAM